MRRYIAAAAVAAVATTLATASYAGTYIDPNNTPFANLTNNGNTSFDLGVDVSNVPVTPQGVNTFLATLVPQGQQIIVGTCESDLRDPTKVQSPRTLAFCNMLLSG